MIDIILIAILLLIVAGIGLYLYKAKKRGQTCIGCPYAKACAKKHGGQCSGSCGGGDTGKNK